MVPTSAVLVLVLVHVTYDVHVTCDVRLPWQARELLLRDIRSHPVKDVRSQMLQDINSGNARKQALKQQQALGRTAQGPDIAPGELASTASSVHQSTGARFSGRC